MTFADLIGLLGILVGLGLLIWFAFKGWSVLLLAPLAEPRRPTPACPGHGEVLLPP